MAKCYQDRELATKYAFISILLLLIIITYTALSQKAQSAYYELKNNICSKKNFGITNYIITPKKSVFKAFLKVHNDKWWRLSDSKW